ncbi:RWD domain-containing protein [Sarocladium implicatum]|nr:RWD domain-containing protein [Sarocladium implicatum]
MGREDQVEEREVLDSIFPEEITDVSDHEFRISVVLDVVDDDEPPSFLLNVRYPEDYPDVAPQLDLLSPANVQPHTHFDISEDRDQLLASLEETIQDNLGMQMVFTLYSSVKESAEQLIQERKDAVLREQEEEALAAEREENKKFEGTAVTRESFLAWREKFQQEMEEAEIREEEERLAELKKARVKEPVKLTGKQLWERGLAGKGDEGDEEDGMPIEGVENLKVEA